MVKWRNVASGAEKDAPEGALHYPWVRSLEAGELNGRLGRARQAARDQVAAALEASSKGKGKGKKEATVTERDVTMTLEPETPETPAEAPAEEAVEVETAEPVLTEADPEADDGA